MDEEARRQVVVAEELGVPMRLVWAAESITATFHTWEDLVRFRQAVHGDACSSGKHRHTEMVHPEIADDWAESVHTWLNGCGVNHKVTWRDGRVTIQFDTADEHAWFVGLRNRGHFDKPGARARIPEPVQ